MEITFIGTGCGIPSHKRGPASVIIKIDSDPARSGFPLCSNILCIDTGPGNLAKLFEIGITYKDIDYLLYTHFHLDHIADFGPIIFASKYELDPRIKDLTVIGPQGMQNFYLKLLDLYGKQIQNLTYNIHIVDLTNKFTAPGWEVSFIKTLHTSESIGYRIKDSKGKVIVYSGDTEPFPELIEFAKGADILVLECAFPIVMPYHLYPDVVGEIAQTSGTKWLIISHLYPVCDERDILSTIRKKFKGKITIAHDLMHIEV